MKIIICYLVLLYGISSAQDNIGRLNNAHSHNDYNRSVPLYEALDNGFTSVEADIYLVDGELFVAHDFDKRQKDKTLKSMYLEPLKEILNNKNSKYSSLFPIILLVDIKNDGLSTYKILEEQLYEYKDCITCYSNDTVISKELNIIISGDGPTEYINKQKKRLAAIDGRSEDINKPENLYPLISDSIGDIIGNVRDRDSIKVILTKLAEDVHNNNKKLRVWGAPDNEESWEIQYDSGLDIIGTDDPSELKKYLIKKAGN